MENKCVHCGADEGLHQYETMKCPFGGYEAFNWKEPRWEDTVFTLKEDHAPWLKQQLKAKDELIRTAKIMLKGIYSTFEERDSESMPGALLALADIIADMQKSLKGE